MKRFYNLIWKLCMYVEGWRSLNIYCHYISYFGLLLDFSLVISSEKLYSLIILGAAYRNTISQCLQLWDLGRYCTIMFKFNLHFLIHAPQYILSHTIEDLLNAITAVVWSLNETDSHLHRAGKMIVILVVDLFEQLSDLNDCNM